MSDKILIEKATAKQLRDFATTVMSLDLGGTENKSTVQAKLQEAGYMSDSFVPVDSIQPSSAKNATAPVGIREMTDKDGKAIYRTVDGKREVRMEVKINIPSQDKSGGDEPAIVGVNGVHMFIPRNKDVWVPKEYIGALNNAVAKVYGKSKQGLGEPREVLAYPFSYVA